MAARKSYLGASVAGLMLTGVLAGCASNGTTNTRSDSSSSGAAGTAAAAPTSVPSDAGEETGIPPQPAASRPGQVVVPVAQSTRCRTGDLRVSLGGGGAAAGTVYRTLRFTNVSGHSCTLRGYPGISYVAGDDGHQLGAPASRSPGSSVSITLAGGQTASTSVGLVNVQNYPAATCRPQSVRGLRVYPPDETRSMFVVLPNTGCANTGVNQLSVNPLQPGPGE
jgi:uncharacterized protein DUF4232